jgi:AAA domain, putative AbiEii toxin, Type IV TA system
MINVTQLLKIIVMAGVSIGRRVLSIFVPSLKALSNEDAYSVATFRVNLPFGAFLLFYFLFGVFATVQAMLTNAAKEELTTGYMAIGVGGLGFVFIVFLVRQTMKERERTRDLLDQMRTDGTLHRDVQTIIKEREFAEEGLFQRNVKADFVLKSFEWSSISVFDDGEYPFAPHVNVLLGKNGYGKTLMFRSLVALLQRDEKCSGLLLPPANPPLEQSSPSSPPRLAVTVERNGAVEKIIRDATYFEDLVGKIPVLAIPDSRFVNRAQSSVDVAAAEPKPLYRSSATHFLTQEPYERAVQELLTSLGLDMGFQLGSSRAPRNRGFDMPIFRMVERVVRELTEDEGFAFASITRVETKLEIGVRTSGSRGAVIPIQAASQGTLSVLVIFGLIYRFLQSLASARRSTKDDDIASMSAIVLIDEIDAHLHPAWQQRIMGILAREFPNVQFIISAHSPLIVAGCDEKEVSVLRKRKESGRFFVHPLPEDFLGAKLDDLYRRLFEIEDEDDRLYLEYSTKGLDERDQRERQGEIQRLDARERRTKAEDARLSYLRRESRLVARAAEVRRRRLEEERNKAALEVLQDEVARLRHALKEKERDMASLKEAAAKGGEDAQHA